MSHRDRVLAALSHSEPDRVPVDLGSTPTTGIHDLAYASLRVHMGLPESRPRTINRMQQIVLPDEDILQTLDVDLRGIYLGAPASPLCRDYPDGRYMDFWGVTRSKPQGSHYYDLVTSPLDRDGLTTKDVEGFQWPDFHDPVIYFGIEERARGIRAQGYAAVLNVGAAVVQISQFMRGYVRWYEDMILNPLLLQAIMDHITQYHMGLMDEAFQRVGDLVDVVFFGDDLGTQRGPQFSPKAYRDLIKPYHRRLFNMARERTGAYVLLHSCGGIRPFIDDLVDAGVDALNPIQVRAEGMSIEDLKARYGHVLTFWGAIDNQAILPSGNAPDVGHAVARTIRILGRGGGYVLSASHNLQPGTPPVNITTMYAAARR